MSNPVESFLATFLPAAQAAGAQLGVDPTIIIAKAALETDWGRKTAGANNFFNVKATGWSGSKGAAVRDNLTGSMDQYRAYATPEQGVNDYTQLIARLYPGAVGSGSDVQAFANGLRHGRAGSYAEDPNYGQKLASVRAVVSQKLANLGATVQGGDVMFSAKDLLGEGGVPQAGTSQPKQFTANDLLGVVGVTPPKPAQSGAASVNNGDDAIINELLKTPFGKQLMGEGGLSPEMKQSIRGALAESRNARLDPNSVDAVDFGGDQNAYRSALLQQRLNALAMQNRDAQKPWYSKAIDTAGDVGDVLGGGIGRGESRKLAAMPLSLAANLVMGIQSTGGAINQTLGRAVGSKALEQSGQQGRAKAKAVIGAVRPEFESRVARGLWSGAESFAQQAPGLIASVMTGNPLPATAAIGVQSGAEGTAEALDAGYDLAPALGIGAMKAAAEVLPERLQVGALLKDVASRTGMAKMTAKQLAAEQAGEQISTHTGDLIDYAYGLNDKTKGDLAGYAASRGDSAIDTVLSSTSMAGLNSATGQMAGAIQDRRQLASASQVPATGNLKVDLAALNAAPVTPVVGADELRPPPNVGPYLDDASVPTPRGGLIGSLLPSMPAGFTAPPRAEIGAAPVTAGQQVGFDQLVTPAAATPDISGALADADARVAAAEQQRSQQARRQILDAVLADPGIRNPGPAFAAELQRQGYRDAAPSQDEQALLARFEAARAAFHDAPDLSIEPTSPHDTTRDWRAERDAELYGADAPASQTPAQASAAPTPRHEQARPVAALPPGLAQLADQAKTAMHFYQAAKKAGVPNITQEDTRRQLMAAFRAHKAATPKAPVVSQQPAAVPQNSAMVAPAAPTIAPSAPKAKSWHQAASTVQVERDSVRDAIARLGGLNKEQAMREWGATLVEGVQSRVFGKPLFRRKGGLPLDKMREALGELGYLPMESDVNALYDAFADNRNHPLRDEALAAERAAQQTPPADPGATLADDLRDPFDASTAHDALLDGPAAFLPDEAHEQAEREAEHLTPEGIEAMQALVEELRQKHGDDADAILERIAMQTAEGDITDTIKALERALNEQGDRQTESTPAERTAKSARSGVSDSQGGQESFLESYDQQELDRREVSERAAEAQRQAEERQAEQKRQADAERDSFTLTGSDRESDQLAARGQGGLFDAPPSHDETTAPPRPERLKNYGWDSVKLAENSSFDELNRLREQVQAEHANPKNEAGRYIEGGRPTIYLYDKAGRQKLDKLAMAVYHKQKDSTTERAPAPASEKPTVPLSQVLDDVNAQHGAGLSADDLVPPHDLAGMQTFLAEVRSGQIGSAEAVRKAFESAVTHREAISAELNKQTKDQLARQVRGHVWSDTKKAQLVQQAYRDLVTSFGFIAAKGDVLTLSGYRFEDTVQQLRDRLANLTDADVASFAERQQQARQEREQRNAKLKQSITDPQTLADFRQAIEIRDGKGWMSDAQRRRYEDLQAEAARAQRIEQQGAKSDVQAAKQAVGATIVETTHTRDGYPLFVVQLAERVGADDYKQLLAGAKKLGGWYSAYSKGGAVPGFQFKQRDTAEAFQQLASAGDTVPVQQLASERIESKVSAKQSAAVTKLRELADKAESAADAELGRDRQTNTARRARMASSAEASASQQKQLARTMRNLADAIEAGDAPALEGLRNKSQVDALDQLVRRAVARADSQLSYSQQQARKGRAPTAEDIDQIGDGDFYPSVHADHLASVARALPDKGNVRLKAWAYRAGESAHNGYNVQLHSEADREQLDTLIERAKALPSASSTAGYGLDHLQEKRRDYERLTNMGITSPAVLRSALREYLQFREGQAKADPVKAAERALIGQKVGVDFFPTPKPLATRMAELAGVKPGDKVLEPSAGNGNLADAAKAAGAEVDTVEISSQLRDVLQAKGHAIAAHDFETFEPDSQYDAVIMNPPFSDRQDAAHIMRAWDMVKPGGKLVAIAGEGVFFGSDKKAQAFRDWLDEHGAEVETLPKGTFEDRTLLATTGANARLIVLEKSDHIGSHEGEGDIAEYHSRPEAAAPRGIAAQELQDAIAPVLAKWRGSPAIHVHQSVAELGYDPQEYGDVEGVFMPGTGEVHLFADAIPSSERALEVLAHEAIGHASLESLLGKELMARLVKNVRLMEVAGNAAVRKAAAVVDERQPGLNATRRAKEIMALMAERGEHLTSDLVQKVRAAVRDWLRRAGFSSAWLNKLDEQDIYRLLRNAERRLESGVSAESVVPLLSDDQFNQAVFSALASKGIQFSRAGDDKSFASQVDDWVDGKFPPRRELGLGETPKVLLQTGADNLPMVMGQSVLSKILKGKHAGMLDAESLKVLPEKLADPIAVFQSRTQESSRVVMTTMTDAAGDTVVIALRLNAARRHNEVNAVASVYGKDRDDFFVREMKQGRLLYLNTEKGREWSQSRGLYLPSEETLHDLNPNVILRNGKVNDTEEGALFSRVGEETISIKKGNFPGAQKAAPDQEAHQTADDAQRRLEEAAPTWRDRLREIGLKGLRPSLSVLPGNTVVEMYRNELPALYEAQRSGEELDGRRQAMQKEADQVLRQWQGLDGKISDRLADLMHQATIWGIHPDQPAKAKWRPEWVSAHKRLAGEWATLPEEAKTVYRTVRDLYDQRSDEMREALAARINRMDFIPATQRQEMMLRLRTQFDQNRGDGPYFPLARFGDYLVIAKKVSSTGNLLEKVVLAAETEFEQKQLAADLQARGFNDVSKEQVKKTFRAGELGALNDFAAGMINRLDEINLTKDERAQLLDDINQLLIDALPPASARKHYKHRAGVAGFSRDAIRAFARAQSSLASHIANLEHQDLIDRALKEARRQAGANQQDVNELAKVVEEMEERAEIARTFTAHPLANALTALGFANFLGFSISQGALNLTQIPLLTYPALAAKFGEGKADKALARATLEVGRAAGKRGGETQFDVRKLATLKPEDRAMLEAIEARGKLDFTMALDLAKAGGSSQVTGRSAAVRAAQWAGRYMGVFAHVSEAANRQVTALAAFRLAREAGMSQERAHDYAAQVLDETQFNYSFSNRPRVMMNNTGRVIGMLHTFAINALYRVGRNLYNTLAGETPQARKQARAFVLRLFAAQTVLAGLSSLPIFPLAAAAGGVGVMKATGSRVLGAAGAVGAMALLQALMSGMAGDDDEPWDWHHELRKFLADITGSNTAAEVLDRGVLRLAGLDVSNRISMNDLLLRDVEAGPRGKATTWLENAFTQTIGGAAFGAISNYARAVDLAKDGHYERAAEAALPKFAGDALKGLRYAIEDVRVIDGLSKVKRADANAYDVALQLFGFTPEKVAEKNAEVRTVRNYQQQLATRRSDLLKQWVGAKLESDAEAQQQALDEIKAFNAKRPVRERITGADRFSAIRSEKRKVHKQEAGEITTRRYRGLQEEGEVYN